jgi:hypothetical protein
VTPKEISLRILEIAPLHGLPRLKVRPRKEMLFDRVISRVRRLVYADQDHMSSRGDTLVVPDGHYWNPPPPQVLVHELAHAEQRMRVGRVLYRIGYWGLGMLHLLTGPLMLLPTLVSMALSSVILARFALLASLAAELVVLGNYAPQVAAGAVGLLMAGYAPFCSPIRARLEIEAHVLDALFVAWSQDMAWDPRFIQRYGDLSATRLQWIHDTITGPTTYWAVSRARGKRMLAEVSYEPERLLLRYPKAIGVWMQLHKEHAAQRASAPTPPSTTAVAIPKP